MVLLGAGADLRFLELREVADPAARTDAAARSQVAVWTDLDVLRDFGLLDDAVPHHAAWPDAAVEHLGIGTDDRVLANDRASLEDRPRLDASVLPDLDAGIDVGGERVGDGHAGAHVPFRDGAAHQAFGDRQLHAIVDSHRKLGVGSAQHPDAAPGRDCRRHQIGQVELALGT